MVNTTDDTEPVIQNLGKIPDEISGKGISITFPIISASEKENPVLQGVRICSMHDLTIWKIAA